jgi:hypothetical protein
MFSAPYAWPANPFISRWPIFSFLKTFFKSFKTFLPCICCCFGVLVVSEQISRQKLRFASYFIHTAVSSQQLSKNAKKNAKKTARLKTNVSATSSGIRGRTRSSRTFLERGRRYESQKGTKKFTYAMLGFEPDSPDSQARG